MRKPHRFFPTFLSFLLLLGVSGAGKCTHKEDFEFLNRTFDEARLVNSGEDFVKSYSVFLLSTLASFEAHYWLLEYVRKRLNPGSELNSYSPDIIEIASIWTAASVIQNGNYTDWPRNSVLHGFIKAGGTLQTVIAGLLLTRGQITVPALMLVFISAESLAEMVSGTFATLILRRENVDPGKILTDKYDFLESSISVWGISWLTGIIAAFEIATLIQISSVRSAALYSAMVALSVIAVKTVIYINSARLSVPARDKTGAGAGAGARAIVIYIAMIIKIAGAAIGAAVGAIAGVAAAAGTTTEAGVLSGIGAGVIAIAGAIAGAMAGVMAGATGIAVDEAIAANEAIATVGVIIAGEVIIVVGAIAGVGVGARALLILAKSGPLADTRYSRVAATIAVASIFAFVSSIANYLNRGVPLDETFSEISGFYWKKAFELVHTPIDYLLTVFYGQ